MFDTEGVPKYLVIKEMNEKTSRTVDYMSCYFSS